MSSQKREIDVVGKIFRCEKCCRKIQIEYEGGVRKIILTRHTIQTQLAYSAEFGQPNKESPELGFYFYDVGLCVACMEKRGLPYQEARVDSAVELHEQLEDNQRRTIEEIKSRASTVLKQVVLDLTLEEVEKAIGDSIDLTFGDKHSTESKKLKLIKIFVQKYFTEIESLIRKKFFDEGSITQAVKQYRQEASSRKRQLKSLLSVVYLPKRTNAAETLFDYNPVVETILLPTDTAPDELFFGNFNYDTSGVTQSLDISPTDCGLHNMLNKKLMYEVVGRLTLQVAPVDHVNAK